MNYFKYRMYEEVRDWEEKEEGEIEGREGKDEWQELELELELKLELEENGQDVRHGSSRRTRE